MSSKGADPILITHFEQISTIQEVANEFLTQAGLITTVANHSGEAAAAMTQDIQAGNEAANEAGMNGYISNPFDPEQLIGTILKWVKVDSVSGNIKLDGITQEQKLLPSHLPGFNLPKALNRLHGNEALLIKLLLRFSTDYASFPSQVDALLNEGQLDYAANLLHRIKGASSTLGATDLAEAAKQFENEIRAGIPLNSKLDFSSCLGETIQTILNNVHSPINIETAITAALDIDDINIRLLTLATCLKNNGLPTEQELAELITSLAGHVTDELLKELDKHIQSFDFDAAVKTLEKVVQEWEIVCVNSASTVP